MWMRGNRGAKGRRVEEKEDESPRLRCKKGEGKEEEGTSVYSKLVG